MNVPWLNTLMDDNAVWINQDVASKLRLKKEIKLKLQAKSAHKLQACCQQLESERTLCLRILGLDTQANIKRLLMKRE